MVLTNTQIIEQHIRDSIKYDWLRFFFDDYWHLFVEDPYTEYSKNLIEYLYTHIIPALAVGVYHATIPNTPEKAHLDRLIDLIENNSPTIDSTYHELIENLVDAYLTFLGITT